MQATDDGYGGGRPGDRIFECARVERGRFGVRRAGKREGNEGDQDTRYILPTAIRIT